MKTSQNIMVKFDLYFDSNVVSFPETVHIGIDQTQFIETKLPIKHVEFQLLLDQGPHTLWIELCGKDPANENRVNGELISDSYLQLRNLGINGSMMNYLLNDNGYVIPDWHHHQDVARWFKENRGAVPDKLEKVTYMNLKSRYYFNFELPIQNYLNRFLSLHPLYAHMYNAPLNRYQALKEKLLNPKLKKFVDQA